MAEDEEFRMEDYLIFRKAKKTRTKYTKFQTQILEEEFRKNKYIGDIRKEQLAKEFNVILKSIKIWFQNKRRISKNEARFQARSPIEQNNLIKSVCVPAKPYMMHSQDQYQIGPVPNIENINICDNKNYFVGNDGTNIMISENTYVNYQKQQTFPSPYEFISGSGIANDKIASPQETVGEVDTNKNPFFRCSNAQWNKQADTMKQQDTCRYFITYPEVQPGTNTNEVNQIICHNNCFVGNDGANLMSLQESCYNQQ
ncbi:hypothetical protein GWI33_013426, partial [Rhynchophorus ferrugineus]